MRYKWGHHGINIIKYRDFDTQSRQYVLKASENDTKFYLKIKVNSTIYFKMKVHIK